MRFILFAILLSFAVPSYSATNYYYMPGYKSSPYDACVLAFAEYTNAPYKYSEYKVTSIGDFSFNCQGHYVWDGADTWSNYGNIRREGDSCPQSQEYNSSTGVCGCPSGQIKDNSTGLCAIPNECTSRKDVTSSFNRVGVAPDDMFSITNGRPVTKNRGGCFEGCAAEMEDLRCVHKTTGSYKCKITASFTGDACGTGGTGPEETTDSAPDPKTDSKTDPCIYKTNSDGTQTCDSSSVVDKEGQNCGTFNGKTVCNDKNANKNEVKVKTDVKTESTPDGGTKITKTDTVNVTTCTGINSCSTTTSTNTTTTTKDSTGKTTGSSSSCVGPSCAATSGQGDGDGDGMGDCVTGECSGGAPTDAELEEVDGFGDSTEKFVNRLGNSKIAMSLKGIKAPTGGECYAPKAELPYFGLVTFDGHCKVLEGNISLIKLIAKTLWAMAAVWILFG